MPVTPKISEPAGVWLRVSSGGQDEANQEPDVLAHCAAKGYTEARRYTVHGKSASKGEQQADLDQAVADMKAGIITVLVIWHSDRIERRPGKALLDTLAEFEKAGGRVESVQEPMLGGLDFGGQVVTFISGLVNAEKSIHLREQVALAQERIRANMALDGRPPWGYTTAGRKYERRLVPTAEGLEWVPLIFAKVAGGWSLGKVAKWLDAKGVKPMGGGKWWPKSLNQLIRNPAYMGLRCEQDPKTRKYGRVLHECDALVPGDVWRAANNALTTRDKHGSRGPKRLERAMLTSVIFCPCGAAMYRNGVFYRCHGIPRLGQESCGNAVKLADADRAVCEVADKTFKFHKVMVRTLVPGQDHQAGIEVVKAKRAHLDQDAEDWLDQAAKLTAELKRLLALPVVAARWEEAETGQTYADLWKGLAPSERGDWLRQRGFRVEATREAVKLTRPGYLLPAGLLLHGHGATVELAAAA